MIGRHLTVIALDLVEHRDDVRPGDAVDGAAVQRRPVLCQVALDLQEVPGAHFGLARFEIPLPTASRVCFALLASAALAALASSRCASTSVPSRAWALTSPAALRALASTPLMVAS